MTNTKGMDTTKQTAVDFLMDKLFDPSMMIDEQVKWFEQAKEIEKEQIMSAYNNCELYNPEQYYEQTYGGKK
jgi:HEPN domain-containing protein